MSVYFTGKQGFFFSVHFKAPLSTGCLALAGGSGCVSGLWQRRRGGPAVAVWRLWRQLPHLLPHPSSARRSQGRLEVPQVSRPGMFQEIKSHPHIAVWRVCLSHSLFVFSLRNAANLTRRSALNRRTEIIPCGLLGKWPMRSNQITSTCLFM